MLLQGWSQERNVATREHITPILRQLHWLPVRRRVEFKMASLVYTKCCQAKYLAIWTIFISPQKVPLAPSGPLRGESALSLVFTVVLVTDVLLQLDHVSETTYLPVCETRKSAAQNSENLTENIHVSDGLRASWLFWLLRLINTLTCLLTYL